MTDEATLIERAERMILRLKRPDQGPPLMPADVADVVGDLITALTQPAPLVPTIQAIAERQRAVGFLLAQGSNAMSQVAARAVEGRGIDERALGMALGIYQVSELINRGAHEPPVEKVDEVPIEASLREGERILPDDLRKALQP